MSMAINKKEQEVDPASVAFLPCGAPMKALETLFSMALVLAFFAITIKVTFSWLVIGSIAAGVGLIFLFDGLQSGIVELRAVMKDFWNIVVSGYALSYGPLSWTIYIPFRNTQRVVEWWIEYPESYMYGLKTLGLAAIVGAFLCSMAHLSSHRYFSHRSFKTSRLGTFCLALAAGASGQRGALWWAAHHRKHHKNCGESKDPHSSKIRGGVRGHVYSQIGWLADRQHFPCELQDTKDWWASAPELLVVECIGFPLSLLFLYCLRFFMGITPVTLGFNFSLHFAGLVNSYCHTAEHSGETTACDTLDSIFVGLITGGEGFHYGHHKFPLCACNAWRWGPAKYLDGVYSSICILERLGLVWDVRHPSDAMFASLGKDE